jgi:hypothetical protein
VYGDEDAELTLEMAESFIRNTSVQSQTAGQNQGAGVYSNRQSSQNVGHRLAQRYSKVENKFTGGDSEDIILSLREYDRSANDFQATSEHRLQFLHNMFHGEAKSFNLDHVDGASTYEDAKEQLISRYCSMSRQVRAQQILEALRLRKVCKEDECSQEKGLVHIKNKIDDLAKLTPEYCRTERARCTYLHKAVVSED